MNSYKASRRRFLQQASAFSGLGAAAAPMALNLAAVGNAAAASASDYKAIVCLFLYGGNDGMHMVLPTDASSWANYSAVRNQKPDSIALLAAGTPSLASAAAGTPARLGGVLPIRPARPQGRTFALHPMLGSLRTLFDTDKRLAILPNIGPLVRPLTVAQYRSSSYAKPASLFSHNDQANTWLSLRPEGSTLGWGGRMADVFSASNALPMFSAVSAAGNSVWLTGKNVQQFQISPSGGLRVGTDTNDAVFSSTVIGASLQRVVSSTRGTHLFERDLAAISKRALDAGATLRSSLRPAGSAPFGTAPSSGTYNSATDAKLLYDSPLTGAKGFNNLALQLQTVARMIDASTSSNIGAKRQVYFVSMGGFDSHDSQNANLADLYAKLAHGLDYFDTALGALGLLNQVTTFTASDFGRTFTSNGDGTDHGWGSHHFVMGGAVKGGDLYGNFPVLGSKNANNNRFDSSPNQVDNGALLPETSVDQLGATLARWFGLSATQIADIFPNLANFDAAKRDLGFFR